MEAEQLIPDISHDVEMPTTSTPTSVDQHEQDTKGRFYLILWFTLSLL